MRRFPMTIHGAEKLRSELEDLKKDKRPKVIQAIAEARAHGDLKENAEYHAAREQQSFIEGRIAEIENKLSFAEVIDVTKIINDGTVVFGATIDLLNISSGEECTYQIVGEDESDIVNGKISVSSPIARSLIGKQEGSSFSLDTPGGEEASYEILEVRYE